MSEETWTEDGFFELPESEDLVPVTLRFGPGRVAYFRIQEELADRMSWWVRTHGVQVV